MSRSSPCTRSIANWRRCRSAERLEPCANAWKPLWNRSSLVTGIRGATAPRYGKPRRGCGSRPRASRRLDNSATSKRMRSGPWPIRRSPAWPNAPLEAWRTDSSAVLGAEWISSRLAEMASSPAAIVVDTLRQLAEELVKALEETAAAVNGSLPQIRPEFLEILKDMPALDWGTIGIELHPGFLGTAWPGLAKRRSGKEVAAHSSETGYPAAFVSYGKILDAWARRSLETLRGRFDAYADSYKVQLARPPASGDANGQETLRRDLEILRGGSRMTDSRQYRFPYALRSMDDIPADFPALPDFQCGLFLPRDEPDWLGRSAYPPRLLLVAREQPSNPQRSERIEPTLEIAVDESIAIESGHALLLGWLRFQGKESGPTLQYNTRISRPVREFLRELKQKFPALVHFDAAVESAAFGELLDLKFRNALASELDPGENALARFFRAARKETRKGRLLRWKRWSPADLAALTNRRILWITDRYRGSYECMAAFLTMRPFEVSVELKHATKRELAK